MSNSAQIAEVVAFFRLAFTLIFALALAEAFKQFLFDRARLAADPVIDWKKLIPLLAFIVLIFPFYQGNIRYLVVTYGDANALQSYSAPIMVDSIAFMWQAALFFVMSRALSPAHWVTYYGAVVMLLGVDVIWGLLSAKMHGTPIGPWFYLNLSFGLMLGIMLFMQLRLSENVATVIGAGAVLVRTTLDYYTSWSFYFP